MTPIDPNAPQFESAGQAAPTATTTPGAAAAAANAAAGTAPIAAPTMTPTPGDALAAVKSAESALQQAEQALNTPPAAGKPSSGGMLSFAIVGMPVQHMPIAIKGNDPPAVRAAIITRLGKDATVDLRVFPANHAPSYSEYEVPARTAANDAGGFWWQSLAAAEEG